MPRLLITGGSSYLGRHLVPLVARRPDDIFCYTYFSQDTLGLPQGRRLDVRRAGEVSALLATFRPDVVIHLAGSNRTPDMTAVIVEGARHVSRIAAEIGARLIHLSTDSIFDGTAAPYDETATPAPLNDYGRAKAEAERLVAAHPNQVTIRTSLIYGLEEMDNGTAWMVEALRAGQPVRLFTNQRRNPVWVETLGRACLELATLDYTGVLNVAGDQTLTRAEFAVRMLDWWGGEERATLTAGPAADGRWPLDCALDLTLARTLLQTPLPGVDDVLRDHQARHAVRPGLG